MSQDFVQVQDGVINNKLSIGVDVDEDLEANVDRGQPKLDALAASRSIHNESNHLPKKPADVTQQELLAYGDGFDISDPNQPRKWRIAICKKIIDSLKAMTQEKKPVEDELLGP